jgi:hypothetical protein
LWLVSSRGVGDMLCSNSGSGAQRLGSACIALSAVAEDDTTTRHTFPHVP